MRAVNEKNQIFIGAEDKESLYDVSIPEDWNNKLIIFVHGFMGFKDWGAWNLVQGYFNKLGFGFLKYNASHNGGTVINPIDFPDIESFSRNTYTKELIDLERIINLAGVIAGPEGKIYLIGHSRGGGIVLLQSLREDITGIAAWAPISDIEKRFHDLEKWKESGVHHQKNSRTNQELPMRYGIYLDYIANKERLSIRNYCERSAVPTVVIHGTEDTSVLSEESELICSWLGQQPVLLPNAQHTFNSSHPWTSEELPPALEEVCRITAEHFSKNEL